MEIIVNDRFRLNYLIAEGGHSSVYHGTDLNTNQEVALKTCAYKSQGHTLLIDEASVIAAIRKGKAEGISTIYWSGRECEYQVMAQELLGPTLDDLVEYCHGFSLKSTLLIADQAIQRLELINSEGYLHGDVKPSNMAMGLGKHGNVLYFIDFGLARKFGQDDEWQSRHATGRRIFTHLYASWGIIDGKGCVFSPFEADQTGIDHPLTESSWADDMESLGYILLLCCLRKYTWRIDCAGRRDHPKCPSWPSPGRCNVERPSVQEMCKGLPEEFSKYFDHIRSLAHGQKPDYAYLRDLFRRLFRENNYQDDNLYDWTLKLYDEVHGIKSTPEEKPKLAQEQS